MVNCLPFLEKDEFEQHVALDFMNAIHGCLSMSGLSWLTTMVTKLFLQDRQGLWPLIRSIRYLGC